jgi:Tol biopolymer transport system component
MNADGRGAEPIVPDGKSPDWAPSGTEIAYVGIATGRVYTAVPDGTDQHVLPADGLRYPPACGGGSNFAVFSPDGRTIAFDDVDGSGDPTIYTMRVGGGRAKQIDDVNTDSAGGMALGLSWQPLS